MEGEAAGLESWSEVPEVAVAALAGFVSVAVLVVLATAATVWLAKVRPAFEHDPDTRFWYAFAGIVVVVPAVVAAALVNRLAGAFLALLAAATLSWANAVVGRRMEVRARLAARATSDAVIEALAQRHRAVVSRWAGYELDPSAAILHPAMNDVRVPETAALVRAMAQAERLRPAAADIGDTDAYRRAVVELETAFRQAETAALTQTAGQ